MYPKADPTPVTSSAPPVSTLYTSPVVSLNNLHNQTWLKQHFKVYLFYTKLMTNAFLLFYSLQNSSAPSAEDVDPEVHVASFSSPTPASS